MVFGLLEIDTRDLAVKQFQFPLGIRWCSDIIAPALPASHILNFNSPWELDGVRTLGGRS